VLLASNFKNSLEVLKQKGAAPSVLIKTYRYQPINLFPLNTFYSIIAPDIKTKKILRNLYNILAQSQKFSPHFVTSPDLISTLSITSEVHIGVALIPPGRINCYYVKPRDNFGLYSTTNNIPQEDGELRAYFTLPPRKKKIRVFSKPKSVFKNWSEDTPNSLAQTFKLDFERSKISRMIKAKIEYEEVYKILRDHYNFIKEEFTSVIVKSSYPHITWNDFTLYCQQKAILCKEISLSVLDRLFIAVNVDLEGGGEDEGNPDRELCRSEFLEIIVRIASAKYKDTGRVKFLVDALSLFLKDLTSLDQAANIHQFRLKEIWTLPVDDLLRSNREGIGRVFTKYSGLKRYLTPADAIGLINSKCKYNIYEADIIKAYGYSKMTIKNEAERFGIVV